MPAVLTAGPTLHMFYHILHIGHRHGKHMHSHTAVAHHAAEDADRAAMQQQGSCGCCLAKYRPLQRLKQRLLLEKLHTHPMLSLGGLLG